MCFQFQQQCANAKYTMRLYNNYAIQLGSWTEINNPWGVDLLIQVCFHFVREFKGQPQKCQGLSAISN